MAFTSLIRRASSSVVPLAIRSLESPRSFRGAISTALNVYEGKFNRRSSSPFQNFSTGKKHISDENLIRVVKNEITYAESDAAIDVGKVPSFPFEIQDKPGERTVTLKGKYEDEEITVLVDFPGFVEEDDDDDKDDAQVRVPLVVNVFKGDGINLEFSVHAFSDKIEIRSLAIKRPGVTLEGDAVGYEGPDFEELDPELRATLLKFLEVRGINTQTTNYLHSYMIAKDSKEYLQWLKNLRHFVEK